MLTTQELLTGVRWRIMQALENGPLSAVQIAPLANTTLAGISQSMQLLEAHGYVTSKALKRKTPGKPTKLYAINKEICTITLCAKNIAQKISFKPNQRQLALLRTFQTPNDEQHWLQKLLCTYEHLFENVALAFVRSEKEETHLLAITQNVERFRKEYTHVLLTSEKEKRKIVFWSHPYEEIKEGVLRKEKYFIDLLQGAITLYDEENLFTQLKKELKT